MIGFFIGVWVGCLIGNFSWAWCHDRNWGEATTITMFQGVPLVAVLIIVAVCDFTVTYATISPSFQAFSTPISEKSNNDGFDIAFIIASVTSAVALLVYAMRHRRRCR